MATTFHFRAVASDGKPRAGTVTAESDKVVAQELRKQGLIPVYIGLEKGSQGFELRMPRFTRGKRTDVLYFTQEISTLLNAGIPLDRALTIAGELTTRGEFRSIVLDVTRLLKGGRSFADSLGAHPAYFPELYTNMVRAGEASGSLSQIFERLAEFEKTRDELRGYIIGSLMYPALLSVVGLGSVLVLLNFVVPRFASIFADPRMKVPTMTLLMLKASEYTQAYGLWVIAALGILAVMVYLYIRTPEGRGW
jgi:general secretion pathway protein F